MDALQLVEALSEWEELPVDAIRAAQANRETMVPVFLRSIEEFLSLEGEPVSPAALFLMFHLLGEWREKSAYWPLAVFLRLPPRHTGYDSRRWHHRDVASGDGGGVRWRSRAAL